MILVLYSACTGSRTIVRIDEAIRALRRRRLATPPCVGWRIVIERKGPRACVFVGYHAICNGEKLSVVRKICWVQLRLLARVTVLVRRGRLLMADSCWRRWICLCGWPEQFARLGNGYWDRLFRRRSARRPSSSVLCMSAVGCRYCIHGTWEVVVSHLRGGSECWVANT